MAMRLTDTETLETWLAATAETVQRFDHEVGQLPATHENCVDLSFVRGMSAMLTRVADMLDRCTATFDDADTDQT